MKIRKLFFLAIITVLLGVVTTCEEEPDSSGTVSETVSEGDTPINIPGGTLVDKFEWLKSNVASNNNYIIEVANDEFINPQYLYFSGRTNITIQLKGIGGVKNIGINGSGSLFTIRNDVTLILKENIVLNGSPYSILVDEGGGTFIMESGKIDRVCVEGGTFTMNGGEISYVSVSGTFIMNGGEISGNVGVDDDGTFIMEGGKISYVGVSGTFIMNGGEISDNTAYGGNGVYVVADGTFTMNDGTITGHTNASGGVCIEGGTFIMIGGTISGNINYNPTIYGCGGGVCVSGGTFVMSGGEIAGNTSSYGGGGVYIMVFSYKNTNFRKTGGIITGYSSDNVNGNVVKDSDGNILNNRGHAIYVYFNDDNFIRFKDTTVGEQDNLSYVSNGLNPPTISGVWDELDE